MEKRIDVLFVGFLCAVVCIMMSFHAQAKEENMENACAWLTDEGYFFVPDLSNQDISPIKIADFYSDDDSENSYKRMYGNQYAKVSEDGRYMFYLSDVNSYQGIGTLYRADLMSIYMYPKEKEDYIIEIDTNVRLINPMDDGKVLYIKEGQMERYCLKYSDGEQCMSISDENAWLQSYQILNTDYVLYSVQKDENEKFFSLYGSSLSGECERVEILSDIFFGWEYSNSDPKKAGYSVNFNASGNFYAIDKDHIYYFSHDEVDADAIYNNYVWSVFDYFDKANLYVTGIETGSQIIAQNVTDVCWGRENGLYYCADDGEYFHLTDYINVSNISEEELTSLVEAFQFIFGVDESKLDTLYYCDLVTNEVKRIGHGDMDAEEWIKWRNNRSTAILYMDFDLVVGNLVKEFPLDKILSDERFGKENTISIVMEYYEEIMEDLVRDNFVYSLSINGREAINLPLMSMYDFSDEILRINELCIFDDGKKLALLDEQGTIFIAEIQDNAISNIKASNIIAESNIYAEEEFLYYKNEDTIYFYDGNEAKEIGENCQYIKCYEDGTILANVDYISSSYGGVLYFFENTGEKEEIGSDVTDFIALQSGGILYLSEKKLVYYMDGVRQRFADNVYSIYVGCGKEFNLYI